MSWPEAGGKTLGVLGYLELCWLSPVTGGVNGQKEADRRSCCTRSFSLLSWLVLYILAFASYKVGSTAMAFGQVQGSAGGGPPLPQILTHLKEAEQQGQCTILGKGFSHMSRMVRLPGVSVGGPPPPSWGQEEHLCSLPGEKGRAIGIGTREGNIYSEAYP